MHRYRSCMLGSLIATGVLTLAGCAGTPRDDLAKEVAADPATITAAVREVSTAPTTICRTERPTGTRVAKRVCRTPDEIAAERTQGRMAIGEARALRGRVRGIQPRG